MEDKKTIIAYKGFDKDLKCKGFQYEEGKDIFQCSVEAEKKGRAMAIEPGEPADLIREDFIPLYKRLGRDRFIEVLKDNGHLPDVEIKQIMKDKANDKK